MKPTSRLFFLTLISFCAFSFPKSDVKHLLSSYEVAVLDLFFRTIIAECSGGYALYGEKPMTVLSYREKEIPLLMHKDLAKKSAIFREGIRVWNNSGLSNVEADFLICNSREISSTGWHDFFLINKKCFLKTLRHNLTLFQYVLGPKVTPQSLLEQFKKPKENFGSILHEDRVLNGIILGYGTQNALYGSRNEYVSEHLAYGKEQVPKLIRHNQLHLVTNRDCAIKNSCPSFGFSSLEQEQKALNKDSFVTVTQYPLTPNLPWFGAFPNKETDILLKNYKYVQKKLSRVLASPRFLEEVLSQFWGYKIPPLKRESALHILLMEKLECEKKLSEYFGHALWHTLEKDAEPEEMESFIQGIMVSNQEPGHSEIAFRETYEKQREWEKLREAKHNLQVAERFFQSLKESNSVIADKIHYRIIQAGKGEVLNSSVTEVVLSYAVSTFDGINLCSKEQEDLKLTEIIAGLAIGIKGMKIGEVREVYIHPAWAYGESCNLEPNLGLIAKVKLLDIRSKGAVSQTFEPLKLPSENISMAEIQEGYSQWTRKLYHQLGQKTWDRMRPLPFVSMEQVIAGLRSAQEGKTIDLEDKWEILDQLDLLSRIGKYTEKD